SWITDERRRQATPGIRPAGEFDRQCGSLTMIPGPKRQGAIGSYPDSSRFSKARTIICSDTTCGAVSRGMGWLAHIPRTTLGKVPSRAKGDRAHNRTIPDPGTRAADPRIGENSRKAGHDAAV